MEQIQRHAEQQIAVLRGRISVEQEADLHLQQLLTATGADLVQAVRTTLIRDFGLRPDSVVDVDNETDFLSSQIGNREDLWIRADGRPILLTEVKGIAGTPKESDGLQVQKYLFPRSKLWNDTNLGGLFIVNHQRGLDPRHRQHDGAFQPDVIENARQNDIALLTTWVLFRLVRGRQRWGWPTSWLVDVLYRPGRPEPVPAGYSKLGQVEHVWKKSRAFALEALVGPVRIGQRLAVLVDRQRFEEWVVDSLRLEDAPVDEVAPPRVAGLTAPDSVIHALREGQAVYIVDDYEPAPLDDAVGGDTGARTTGGPSACGAA